MVERGQVLERMTLVLSEAGELEALYQPGTRSPSTGGRALPVVLAPSHPRWGGTMDSAVLGELVWCLARRGHATLRFNWRGAGASPGTSAVPWPPAAPETLDNEMADLNAAILQHAPAGPCALVGVGFGASVAARVATVHERVERVILIAPPVATLPIDWAALAASGTIVSTFVGGEDTVAPAAALETQVRGLFPVQVIPGANHGFTRGLGELGRRVAEVLPGALDD